MFDLGKIFELSKTCLSQKTTVLPNLPCLPRGLKTHYYCQLISKRFFGILEFFQKRMKEFNIVLLGKKTEFVRSFFGRI